MHQMNRRKLLSTAAVGLPAIALAGCTSTQIASFEANWSSFVAKVQSLVNQAAGYIPTIQSIANQVAAMFGPTWQTAVALTNAVVNQVVAALQAIITAASPPAVSSFASRLNAAPPGVAVRVGTTKEGVTIYGYRS